MIIIASYVGFLLGINHFKDVSLPINIFRLFQMGVKKEDPLEQDLTFIGF